MYAIRSYYDIVSTTEDLTMGGLIATTILSGRVLSPIAMLPNLLVMWGKTKIAVEDLDQVYALERDNEGLERPVITSYSIHYTKLYEVQSYSPMMRHRGSISERD